MKYLLFVIPLFLLSCAQVSFTKTETGMDGEFRLKERKNVSIYTSVDGYAEHKALLNGKIWKANMPYAKEFRYFMTADGRAYLPDCPLKEYDDFGSQLCIYEEN